jgi:hypothetical protein
MMIGLDQPQGGVGERDAGQFPSFLRSFAQSCRVTARWAACPRSIYSS